jgi:hypothetical protein
MQCDAEEDNSSFCVLIMEFDLEQFALKGRGSEHETKVQVRVLGLK